MANSREGGSPFKREDIVYYIIDSYAGIEENEMGIARRMFLWMENEDDVWFGNIAAFAEHLAQRFDFELLKYDYVAINNVLLGCGERLKDFEKRSQDGSQRFQAPLKPRKERAR
jgi:hypothetical protein